jgi:predicted hydrocarbon binding protein
VTTDILSKLISLNMIKMEGGRITINDKIMVGIPVAVLNYLRNRCFLEYGVEKANEMMFDAGRYHAKTSEVSYSLEMKNIYQKVFPVSTATDPKSNMGRELLNFFGWGDAECSERRNDGEWVVLNLINSPIAKQYVLTNGKSEKPICHYMLGLFHGILEKSYGVEYESIETSCAATGMSENCMFKFTKKNNIEKK